MPHVFTAAPHGDILALLIQVAILLFTARMLGELAQRLGQPSVVGEILAGIVLGPSLLSSMFPAFGQWIVPQSETQGYLLELVGLIGVLLLLLITGLETDLALIRRQFRQALSIALGGLILPLILGFSLGYLLPADLRVLNGDRVVFSLFLATAMAISAIPVIAKVLMDLKLTRRTIGQTLLAAAMIDDTIGWILLSVVISLASGSAVTFASVGQSVFTVLAFMGLSLTVGSWLLSRALHLVQNRVQMDNKILWFMALLMFTWAAIGQALGIEALLGAFIVGIVFSRLPQLGSTTTHQLESIALGIFAPIFFAVAGLKVNIGDLLEPRLLLITLLVVGVALTCKMLGVYIGAHYLGKADRWTSLFYGAGLNARGSIGIIVANIGLSLGILSQDMFSIIVVMAVVTSLMAPAVMRWAARHIKPAEEELDRLKREELHKQSLFANIRRVLLPVRLRDNNEPLQLLEARILERISAESNIDLTLLTVSSQEEYNASVEFLDTVAQRFSAQNIIKKVVVGDTIGDRILDEARNDYDLMILGTPEERRRNCYTLFTPLLDYLMHMSPCPTMLVQDHGLEKEWMPRRILVPTNGSQPARRAAEVAFAMAARGSEELLIMQVVEENYSDYHLDATGSLFARQQQLARESVEKLRKLAELQGIRVMGEVRSGVSPEVEILKTVDDYGIDLIVLGTSVGVGSERLYLGPRVERILKNVHCPVVVINT